MPNMKFVSLIEIPPKTTVFLRRLVFFFWV